MKAITTKYLPATKCKPMRVVASTEGGNRIVISYDLDSPTGYGDEWAYRKAAQALCDKMDWPGELIGGRTENGYVFVFADTVGRGHRCTGAPPKTVLTIIPVLARRPAHETGHPKTIFARASLRERGERSRKEAICAGQAGY